MQTHFNTYAVDDANTAKHPHRVVVPSWWGASSCKWISLWAQHKSIIHKSALTQWPSIKYEILLLLLLLLPQAELGRVEAL